MQPQELVDAPLKKEMTESCRGEKKNMTEGTVFLSVVLAPTP